MTLIYFTPTKTSKILFETVNKELHCVIEWFKANKLSVNSGKLNIYFFHKESARDGIPLRLPTITFYSIETKRDSFIRFLGVIIDENLE